MDSRFHSPSFTNDRVIKYSTGDSSSRAESRQLRLMSKATETARSTVRKKIGQDQKRGSLYREPESDAVSHYPVFRTVKRTGLEQVLHLLSQKSFKEAYALASSLGTPGIVYLHLFRVPPGERGPVHTSILAKALFKLAFFKKLPPVVLENIAKIVVLLEMRDGTVIFKQGAECIDFYVILSGMVDVVINNQAPGSAINGALAEDTLGVTVASLHSGDSFGEHPPIRAKTLKECYHNPLLAPNTYSRKVSLPPEVRAASCRCASDCQLLRLDQEEYDNVLAEHGFSYFYNRLITLDACLTFRSWDEDKKQELAKTGKIKKFNPGSVIIRQGQQVEQLGIIRRGLCNVIMRLPISKLKVPLVKNPKPGDLLEAMDNHNNNIGDWVIQNRQLRKTIKRRGYDDLFTKAISSSQSESVFEEEVVINTLTSGQVFGELCLLDSLGESRVSLVAESVLEVLTFDKKILHVLRAQYNQLFLQHLQESFLLNNPTDDKVIHYHKSRNLFNTVKNDIIPNNPKPSHEDNFFWAQPQESQFCRSGSMQKSRIAVKHQEPFIFRSLKSTARPLRRLGSRSTDDFALDSLEDDRINITGLARSQFDLLTQLFPPESKHKHKQLSSATIKRDKNQGKTTSVNSKS